MSYFTRWPLRKYNKNHDPENGRFASGPGGSVHPNAGAMEKGQGFTAEQQKAETHFADYVTKNYDEAVRAYNALHDSNGGQILGADIARELSADYLADRTNSAAVQEPASWLVKQMYAEKLKQEPGPGHVPVVLFTAGGTGAGKTSSIANLPAMHTLSDQAQIIYDGNLDGYNSALNKINQALTAGKDVHIAMVQRDPVDAMVNGVLPRAMKQEAKFGTGRTVPMAAHIKTHTGVADSVSRLATHFKDNPRVKFTLIDNSLGLGKAKVVGLDKLVHLDYNKTVKLVGEALEKQYESGKISESVYRGIKGKG